MSNLNDFGVIKESQFLMGTGNWTLDWMAKFMQGAVSSIADLSRQAKIMSDQLPAHDQAAAAATKSSLAGLTGQPTQSA
ncbi:MAG: hypothetical protein DLM59_00575 [Pseudonocardiales bacterium]|nr:MAG: hypothetical protein DLM59_00575 [Pseudonocardiales bacterium]